MKRVTVSVLAVCLSLLVGCSNGFNTGSQKDTSAQIIRVNKAAITQKMFDDAMDITYNSSALAARNVNLKDPKNKPLYMLLKGKIVNDLIVKALIAQEAEKRNIKVGQEDVDKAIAEITQKIGGKEKLEAQLTLNNIDKATFVSSIKTDLMTRKLIDTLSVGVNVSEKDAQDFYNKNRTTKFTTPDMVKAKHILIAGSDANIRAKLQAENPSLSSDKLDKKVTEEAVKSQKKAENILSLVQSNPAKFEEMAKTYSDDQNSAVKGGDLGYFSQKDMVPAFAKAAFKLSPGTISGLVKTEFGYHIIKVVDRKKAGIVPYIEVREQIAKFLTEQNKMALLQKLIMNAKNTADIVYLNKDYNVDTIQKELTSLVKNNQKKAPKVADQVK